MSASSASPGSYSFTLRSLHWLMAAFILLAIALGVAALFMTPGTPVRMAVLGLHKSLGITVLVLAVLRVAARLMEKAPPYASPLGKLNHALAGIVHLALYAAMFALPISGYVNSEAGNHPFTWFGLFTVPDFIAQDKTVQHSAGKAHYLFALLIGAALVAHIAGAYWHALAKKDFVFTRMWPSWRPKRA